MYVAYMWIIMYISVYECIYACIYLTIYTAHLVGLSKVVKILNWSLFTEGKPSYKAVFLFLLLQLFWLNFAQ